MKLVAGLIVKNEMSRYLPECIGHLLDFVDQIVVMDDGSTDRTGEWLDDNSKSWDRIRVHHVDPEDGFFAGHEGRKRQQLLIHTLNEAPDWVLNIDADEFVTDGSHVRNYIDDPAQSRQVGTLDMEEVWKADSSWIHTRMDGGWRPHPVPCLWSAKLSGMRGRALQISNKALACGREPEVVRRYFGRARPTGASILHFGWANQSARRPRYERYVEADGGQYHRNSHLESIMWDDEQVTLAKQTWPKHLSKFKPLILQQANFDFSGGYA